MTNIEPTTAARRQAEKFRIHILNIALATRSGREGALREATEMFLDAISDAFDRATKREHRQ